ncbi:maleylpyruvate isomerase family mycothiol-dependent enzyme [Cellulomonas sp. DKR-3]|uniref:Maleylpyruvate isomerase family mycothiol-dependent enzyme n=1 Tax=Cellulomonas fulva TaxID=2835530 RepID=A0ABS5TUL5_9CELL|nr:maleylpyruvate isomerase family mycothiol-dependent enzyme [Cellulomonas fulva]MBT0992821.1 maleylpyruvate isomerase family mycothiol-dependent enzyme [Cellulomonas fulva]
MSGVRTSDVWPVVHAERQALVSFLEPLAEERWATPSLCEGWSVHDVVAHLVDTARTTRRRFVVGLAAARFDFDRQNAKGVARERGATPAITLERLRAVTGLTASPPAAPETRLVEAVVHGEDVRVPLGATGHYPHQAVERALRYQARTSVSFGGGRQHVVGLALEADDADVVVGSGPAVRGPLTSLLLVASGRRSHLPHLSGPGVVELERRLS